MHYFTSNPYEEQTVETCSRCKRRYVRLVSLSSLGFCADCFLLKGHFPEMLGGWTDDLHVQYLLKQYYERDEVRRVWRLKCRPFFTRSVAIAVLVIAVVLFVLIW